MKKKKNVRLEKKIIDLVTEKGITPEELRLNIDAVKHPSSFPVKDLSSHVKDDSLTIGIVSDTCLNSKYERLDILHTAYNCFKELGASYVLHCGNITDGYMRTSTHVEHIFHQDYKGMLEYIEKVYPKITGLNTYFIGGRNERTFFRRIIYDERGRKTGKKTNVCSDINLVRPDLIFLGWNNAKVRIASKTTLALTSPKNGSRKPYTISHPIQKILESYSGGEKPDLQIVGYYTQRWSGHHLGAYAGMVGTTQNQPPEGYSDAEPPHTLSTLAMKFKFKKGTIIENGLTEIEIPFYE